MLFDICKMFVKKLLQNIDAAKIFPANTTQLLKMYMIHITSNKQFAYVNINYKHASWIVFT